MAKLLLVEDSQVDVQELTVRLERAGHQILVASSGEQGVVLAANEQPDVILMDVVMPGINGFQATRQIKRSADTKHIPVIIISSKSQEVDIIWGARQGAAHYLVKPVAPDLLESTIADALATPTQPTLQKT